jgi:prepilin-type N-terminal cleavage/methylation domain-containing protein
MLVRPRRSGFTLLEMVLALAIAVLLMGAVYVALDVQLRVMQEGREVVERSTLTRALLQRITRDINSSLGPTGSRKASTSTTTTDASADLIAAFTSSTNPPAFQLGIQGGSDTLTIYTCRAPSFNPNDETPEAVSDLRRVSYWIADGGGLARYEQKLVTSDEAIDGSLPTGEEERKAIVADEVQSLVLRYFDGTNWTDTWDGSTLGSDGATPIGPPVAVEVTLTFKFGTNDTVQTIRHVVAIATAAAASTTTEVAP